MTFKQYLEMVDLKPITDPGKNILHNPGNKHQTIVNKSDKILSDDIPKIKMLQNKQGPANMMLTPSEVQEITSKYHLTLAPNETRYINSKSKIAITLLPNGFGKVIKHV